MTQFVGDVTRRAARFVTVQLYLRTGRPAEIRNLISQTCILSDLSKRTFVCVYYYSFGLFLLKFENKNELPRPWLKTK